MSEENQSCASGKEPASSALAKQLPIVIIDGEMWPHVIDPDNLRSAKRLKVLPSDVFVSTYPKSGTTWIQHICSQLLTEQYSPSAGKELCITSPLIEFRGSNYIDRLPNPRLLKTHFSYNHCPKSTQAKYIYAVRNPKDVLTSYYFHHQNFKLIDSACVQFDAFFELFLEGQLAYGDYFSHLLSWLPHCNEPNVLLLKYEEMLSEPEKAIVEIGQFLGGSAAQVVSNHGTLKRIAEESTFEAMKQNQWRWFPENYCSNTFIRKGVKRDWKNHMSKEQSDRVDQIFGERLGNTEAQHWWTEEMKWD